MKSGWVYILKCADSTYYSGSTSNLLKRIAQHNVGSFSGYTSARRPVTLIWSEQFVDISDAVRAEGQIKGWSRRKKEALISGDYDLLRLLAKNRVISKR